MNAVSSVVLSAITVVLTMYISYKVLKNKITADIEFARRFESRRWLKAYVSFVEWFARLVPPLLLIPLFWTPWDNFIFGYWIVGFVVCVVSVGSLTRLWLRAQSGLRTDRVRASVRSALSASIFVFAAVHMWHHSGVVRTAIDNLGRMTAQTMLAKCVEQLECPEMPPGWQAQGTGYCTEIEFMDACYSRNEDLSSFVIAISHRMDDYLIITGGINLALKEEYICC